MGSLPFRPHFSDAVGGLLASFNDITKVPVSIVPQEERGSLALLPVLSQTLSKAEQDLIFCLLREQVGYIQDQFVK